MIAIARAGFRLLVAGQRVIFEAILYPFVWIGRKR